MDIRIANIEKNQRVPMTQRGKTVCLPFVTVRKWIYFLSLILCLYGRLVSAEEAAETLVLKVFLNTLEQGEFVLIQTSDTDILFPQESFETFGFIEIPKAARVVYENADYVSMRAIRGVLIKIDTEKATLSITADPLLLQKQVQDLLKRNREVAPQLPRIPSAFINYNISYDFDNLSGRDLISLPLELGLGARELFGLSTFFYAHTPTDASFRRISSQVTWDDTKRFRRIVLGDFISSSGGLGSALGGSGPLGGISLSKNFVLAGEYFSPYIPLNLSGVLETPSDVELLLNGLSVAKEHFGPGPFEFTNVPTAAGVGEGYLIIRDAFGREKGIPVSYYYIASLLKVGLQEYNYQIGAKRVRDRYGEMAVHGSHRIGVTNSLTLGMRAEADEHRWNGGPTARFQVASFGDIDLAVATSRDTENDARGDGELLTYGYGRKFFHLNGSASRFDRHYSNLSLESNADKPRRRWQIGVGIGTKNTGSLSVNYQEADLYLGADRRVASVSYSTVWKKVSMRVSASRSFGDKTTNELLLGISTPLQNKQVGDYLVSADQATREDRSTQTLFLNKNPPQGIGKGGSLRVIRDSFQQERGIQTAETSFTYKGVRGVATADYELREGGYRASLDWSGALVATRGKLYMSQSISDGFALVTLDGVRGVRISSQNSVATITNDQGEAIVPNIHSYTDNQVTLNDQDVPADYMLSSIQKRFSIPNRAGVYLPFEATRIQGFVGFFYVLEGAVKTPAEYWGLATTIKGHEIEVIVGNKGEFYLENLNPGKYPARLFTKGKECLFEINIPDESNTLMVNMGDVVCTMP